MRSKEIVREYQKMFGRRTFVVAAELAEALGPHLDCPPPPTYRFPLIFTFSVSSITYELGPIFV
jgi:hypothetical protein